MKLAAPPCVFAKNVPFSRTDADALFEHAVPTYRTPILVAVYVRPDADDVTDVGVPTVNVVQSINCDFRKINISQHFASLWSANRGDSNIKAWKASHQKNYSNKYLKQK